MVEEVELVEVQEQEVMVVLLMLGGFHQVEAVVAEKVELKVLPEHRFQALNQ